VKDGVAVGLLIQSETMFGTFLTYLMKPTVSGVQSKVDLAVERSDF
jgi:hypothetical protein